MAVPAPADSLSALVSVDPALVRQISSPNTSPPQLDFRPKHNLSPSTPNQQDDRESQIGHNETHQGKSRPKSMGNTGKTSLRRVKDSTEVLRQRSTKNQPTESAASGYQPSNEGRHFTVANVGTGGKLYLRPAANQHRQRLPPAFVFRPPTPADNAPHDELERQKDTVPARESIWSSSQISEKPTKANLARSATFKTKTPDEPPPLRTHTRAHSFSTLDDTNKSSTALKDGVLRVVIDRSAVSRPKTAEQLVLPSLEIPIPHYRLGKPHFGTEGTPILRSSAYTQTSADDSENVKSSPVARTDLLSAPQSGLTGKSPSRVDRPGRLLSPNSASSGTSRDSTAGKTSLSDYSYREPINPDVFDRLNTFKDDATVVRYSQRTGAITAATPARIVAQISSEAFMDYELVSDFFLTFRAYLTTENLLSLLLARLRWAINRLEDDGRIIRIRTFAALRHWILNYFVDDFVVNRRLRVQFCDHINEMYHEVSKRTAGGVSDLKILVDLKRCWNGRCSLYWDSTDFIADNQQEADIVPGGVLGSRDPSLTQLDVILDHEAESLLRAKRDKGNVVEAWYGLASEARVTDRPSRNPTPRMEVPLPTSPTSEQSLQAASCSIPTRQLKRSPPPEGLNAGPYPVSIQPKTRDPAARVSSSMNDPQHRPNQAHKRRASTSDSIRDGGRRGSLTRPVFLVNSHAGSLIRGDVYPPTAPFVDVIARDFPPSQRQRLVVSPIGRSGISDAHTKTGLPMNPGMKTFMGSIRRALSSKQTTSALVSSTDGVHGSVPSLQGKTSGLPMNMARSTDTLRDKRLAQTTRRHLRIDLLCAAVSQSYQMVQAKASHESFTNHGLGVSISDIHEDSRSQQSLGSEDVSKGADGGLRILGHEAARSGTKSHGESKRLLVPDPKGPPDMEGRRGLATADFDLKSSGMVSMPDFSTQRKEFGKCHILKGYRRSSSVDSALARGSREQKAPWEYGSGDDGPGQDTQSSKRPIPFDHERSFEPAESTFAVTTPHGCKQGTIIHHESQPHLAADDVAVSTKGPGGNFKAQGPSHTLRRRPGGNLRNIEHVHDLAPVRRRQSTGSLATQSESVGSLLVIGTNRVTPSKKKAVPQHPISLIRTHSSQQLRPSFEAVISGFSTIQDDTDGGLEATLLKLEGRYQKSSRPTTKGSGRTPSLDLNHRIPYSDRRGLHCQQDSSQSSGDSALSPRRSKSGSKQQDIASRAKGPSTKSVSTRSGRSKSSKAYSEDSYSSVPLLERGLGEDLVRQPKHLPKWKAPAAAPLPLLELGECDDNHKDPATFHSSIEVEDKTQSISRTPRGLNLPGSQLPAATDSFLLDEGDSLTDLSSELSDEEVDQSEVESHNVSVMAATGTATLGHQVPTHPLAHPPSPAFSIHNALASVPPLNTLMYQQKPLTPQPSPTQGEASPKNQDSPSQILPPKNSVAIGSATVTSSAGHVPFVLACESEILAQQFTLVEKAALSEIDWSDLVDMKWDNKSTNILNWVEYLAIKDHKGIDIVITRFNIVVKWVVSEIVMTQDLHERAQAITKYIHIAAYSKQMRNYASMLQITIGLTSIDCTRLKATWELVPAPERALLEEMEVLIQPVRNFHDLRIEMETASLQDGCIPFVGLYLHDLTYNAQKPSQIVSPTTGEPLVNFEKYRTTATIVKSLLRLIEASTRYNFTPIPGIIERCLWMAALSDDKITNLSKSIEH